MPWQGIFDVVSTLITFAATVLVGRWAYKAKKDSAATLFQVANDHDSNLRDDLTQVIDTQREHTADISIVKAKVTRLEDGRRENREDINWLIEENTEQRRRRENEQWREPLPGGRRDRRMR